MLTKIHYWLLTAGWWLLNAHAARAAATAEGERVLQGLDVTARHGGLIGRTPPAIGPAALAGAIIGYLLAFVGVIFFALILYGGFLWMTARGNEEQVKKALELIKSAVVGLVIVFISYVVTQFILSRFLSAVQ